MWKCSLLYVLYMPKFQMRLSPTRHYSCMLLLLTLEYFKNVRESGASMPQSSKQAPFTSEVEDLIPAIRTHVQKTVGQHSSENRGFSLCKLVRIVVIGWDFVISRIIKVEEKGRLQLTCTYHKSRILYCVRVKMHFYY